MPQVDVEALKQEILSLLVSAKGGLTEFELLKDYRQFNSNRELPYKDLGYPSLVPLLRSWPDVCRLQSQGNNGAMRILAVEEENTKHILSMVQGQRPGKNRRRGRGGAYGRPGRGRGGGGRMFNDENNYGGYSSRGGFSGNRNRSDNTGRGSYNGRFNFNNHRMDRSTPTSRPTTGSYNQYPRNDVNSSGSSRLANSQPNKSNPPASVQPSTFSSEKKSATNAQFPDDRRVNGDYASMRITVANNTQNPRNNTVENTTYDRQYSSDRASRASDTESRDDDTDEYDEDRIEEVLDNLRQLLVKYSHGIRLLSLDDLYQSNFNRSLLSELKITNILFLQDFVDEFATIARHGEENGSSDHIITLKDPKLVAESQAKLLRQITASGPVPSTFRFATNLFSYITDRRFQGYVSDIDKHEHCLHVQPVRYQTHIETLMEELDSYYSSAISNQLVVKSVETGLCCVTKFDDIYHRVFIKESDLYRCVIVYVDYGTTEEIQKDEQEFKYLLNHFAELPCMAIACRLHDLCFSLSGQHWSTETYEEIYKLCKNGPFFIEPVDSTDGLLNIRILDADERCLNDIILEFNLAVSLSAMSHSSSIDQKQGHRSEPITVLMDYSDNAARCPLPDSEPSSPDVDSVPSNGKYSQNVPSDLPCRCKLIAIDARTSFHLISYGANKPHITCADLARLLNVSESQILSETLLSRLRLTPTAEYQSVFTAIQQNNSNNCLHLNQNFLFIFDLESVVKYMEKVNLGNTRNLIAVFREQIDASKDPRFWSTAYASCKRPSAGAMPTPNPSDVERYNELLSRRNILCNLLRTSDIGGSSVELESIENELQQVVEKMRLGATSASTSQVSLTPPPGFTVAMKDDQQRSDAKDKLKDLMQRCKTLINTILILDDYVMIDDRIIDFIQASLPFLNSSKALVNEDQLLNHYSDLLQSLTIIVNDLQQRLPMGMNIC